jgi:hypothetical protein
MGGEHWGFAYLDTTSHRMFWPDSLEGVYKGGFAMLEMLI